MTTRKTQKTTITYALIALVVIIGIIWLATTYTNTLEDLSSIKTQLTEAQDDLQLEIEKSVELNENLEMANAIIEALKDEEYIVGTTVTNKEIEMLAKTVYGEARGCSTIEQSAVVWCILNRVDAGRGSIAEVITAPGQFSGYSKNFPVTNEIKALVQDVIARWKLEKVSCGHVGRTLPKKYLYFNGRNGKNYFRDAYKGDYNIWDWDCWNPYS